MAGLLRGYRVRLTNVDRDVTEIINTDTINATTATGLDCCAEYSFTVAATTIDVGSESEPRTFRTMPDLTGKERERDVQLL